MTSQLLHIFRKDVYHQWLRLVLLLLVMAAHAVFEVRGQPFQTPEYSRINAIVATLDVVLPLLMWFVIASVIFDEALPGHRQFWITRPYRRASLLGAKLLFVFVFVSVPLFLSDCYILGTQGFAVSGVLPQLLERQSLVALLFILPAFAIATLSSGFAQFLLSWFVLILSLLLETMIQAARSQVSGVDYVFGGGPLVIALVIAACAVILWQYMRRHTIAARAVLLTSVCALMPATELIARLNARNVNPIVADSGAAGVRISYSGPPTTAKDGRSPEYPLEVTGLPPATLLRGAGIDRIDGNYYSGTPPTTHVSLYLEIVTDEVKTRMPLRNSSFWIPGAGYCRIERLRAGVMFFCRAGLEQSSETEVRLSSEAATSYVGTTSLPAGLSPTTDEGLLNVADPKPGTELLFIPRRLIAKLTRTLKAKPLH